MGKASGPLILIIEIAPVPGTVAGAYIVFSFSTGISNRLLLSDFKFLEFVSEPLQLDCFSYLEHH